MMTKKEKKKAIITLMIIIFALMIVVFAVLYIATDMFKSNKSLFFKYLGKNAENLETIIETLDNTNVMDDGKYESKTEIKMNLTENIGTSLENADNAINDLKMTIDSQNDKENKYNYKDIKLLKKDEKVSNIEYIQQENNYGIKFSDLFNKYLLVGKENIQQFLEKTEMSQEQLDKIQKILEEDDTFNAMQLNEKEIETLKNKYVKIVKENSLTGKFSKKKNQQIKINQKPVYVNKYTLTLTKEQLNGIFIKLLETIKDDEILLKRLEYLQIQINKINLLLDKPIDVKQDFTSNIEQIIEDINKNNIGNEDTEIVIYENAKKTVRTSIQTDEYQIDIDVFQNGGKFIEISRKENENETQKITIDETQNKFSINVEDNKAKEPYKLNFERTKEIKEELLINNSFKYEKNDYKFETRVMQNIKKVEGFERQTTITKNNAIKLDELKQEELTPILEKVEENLNPEIDRIKQEINIEDIQKLENMLGIKKNVNVLNSNGAITEAEKNRFNSKFQFLKTESLSSEELLSAIKTFEENFADFEIISGSELKIKISRSNKNEERIKTLKDFVEDKKRLKYTLSVEYDDVTGLVEYVTIKIITDK